MDVRDSLRLVEELTRAWAETDARWLHLHVIRRSGLRGLEVRHPGITELLKTDPKTAVGMADKKDVPNLYWTAASWGSAISLGLHDPDLIADLPSVEAMIDRALALDETYDSGAIHSFLVTFEMIRQGAEGEPADRSRKHFERAVELSGGQQTVSIASAILGAFEPFD